MTVKVKHEAVLPVESKDDPEGATTMGEVRAQLKLTNAVDEGMLARGLLKPERV